MFLRNLAYVKVRNKCIRKLLASRQGVEDQVLQRSDLTSSSGNVDKLLSFARGGILRALLKQILKYVGDTEDCIAVLWVYKPRVPTRTVGRWNIAP